MDAGAASAGDFWGADMETVGDRALCFRSFRLLPSARSLECDGRPVEIGSRAFDLLHVLLKSRGSIVERDVIIRHVWPTTTVDETNLRSQVAQVRQVLGAHRDLLKTVPGRGYLLAADAAPPEFGGEGAERAMRRAGSTASVEPLRSDASETEALRRLLRSVLDELWEMKREAALARKPPCEERQRPFAGGEPELARDTLAGQ